MKNELVDNFCERLKKSMSEETEKDFYDKLCDELKETIATAAEIPMELLGDYSEIYFRTSDNDITTGTKLRWVMFIIFGNGPFNNDDVRRFAKSCTSIVEEIDTPSIEDLIRSNKITSAVYLYYKIQNGSVTMSEAKDYVLELEKSMKN